MQGTTNSDQLVTLNHIKLILEAKTVEMRKIKENQEQKFQQYQLQIDQIKKDNSVSNNIMNINADITKNAEIILNLKKKIDPVDEYQKKTCKKMMT